MSHCEAYRQKSVPPHFVVCNVHVFHLFKGIILEICVHLEGVRVILARSILSMCILQIKISFFFIFDSERIPI